MTSNNDIYRESIEPEDMGEEKTDSTQLMGNVQTNNVQTNNDNQIERVEKELEAHFNENIPQKKETEDTNIIKQEIEKEIVEIEDNTGEQRGSVIKIEDEKIEDIPEIEYIPIKKQAETKEPEEESIVEIKVPVKEEPITEIKIPEKTEEVVEEIKTPVKEEPIAEIKIPIEEKPVEDFNSLYTELWEKVNPNKTQEAENKKELTDIAVKVTILKEDLEDKEITEEEAIQKIKKLKQKIQ